MPIMRRAFLPKQHRSAVVRSLAPDDGTISVIFTTGADVLRFDPLNGAYIERLLTGPENVRLDRLNAGAPFLDTHNAYSLGSVIGAVIAGSARMENGRGLCDVRLSKSARAADTVNDIYNGVITNISVGYDVHAFMRTEAPDGSPAAMVAIDWEPMEVSAVPIGADADAQITARTRSASGLEVHSCQITILPKGATMPTSQSETRRGYERFSQLCRKAIDPDVVARLSAQAEPTDNSHASPAADASERAKGEAWARKLTGRTA